MLLGRPTGHRRRRPPRPTLRAGLLTGPPLLVVAAIHSDPCDQTGDARADLRPGAKSQPCDSQRSACSAGWSVCLTRRRSEVRVLYRPPDRTTFDGRQNPSRLAAHRFPLTVRASTDASETSVSANTVHELARSSSHCGDLVGRLQCGPSPQCLG